MPTGDRREMTLIWESCGVRLAVVHYIVVRVVRSDRGWWAEVVRPMADADPSDSALLGPSRISDSTEPTCEPPPLTQELDSGVVADDVFGAAPGGMIIVDERGRMLLVNASVERLFGYNHGELQGQPIEVLVPNAKREDHEARQRACDAALQLPPVGTGLELLGRRRDRSEFLVEISLSPLQTALGTWLLADIRGNAPQRAAGRSLEAKHVVREANRIADDLSRAVVPDLFKVGLRLESVAVRVNDDVRIEVLDVIDSLDIVIREIRDVVFGLAARGPGGALLGGGVPVETAR